MEFDKNEINLEKYIQGELSGDALKEFETQIEKNEVLQKEVNFHQYTDAVLNDNLAQKRSTADLDAEFKSNLNELGNKYFPREALNERNPATETIEEKTIAKPSLIKRLIPFATLAAAAAFLLFLFLPDRDSKLYKSYFESEKLIRLQGQFDNSSNFDNANRQYESENYKEAKILYDKFLIENPNNPWALAYKGCSEMELTHMDKAIRTFQILAAKNNDFADMANWYLSLCYLKKGDKVQTINFLKSISPAGKEYGKAQQLLKEL